MDEHKEDFIDFMLEHRVIEFEHHLIKSGRLSPYIINIGNVGTSAGMNELSRFYAEVIRSEISVENADIIFGPAYKGIALCVSTAGHLNIENEHIGFLHDRKEEKKYAEGRDGIKGLVVGKIPEPYSSIVIVDDVLTSGQTKRQCIDLLHQVQPTANVTGLIVAVDRQETDLQGLDAITTFTDDTGIPVYPIVTISDILGHLVHKGLDEQREKIQVYLNTYGIASVRE